MKVTKISAKLNLLESTEFGVEKALLASFSPFGSLTEGLDGRALARAMIRWVDADAVEQPQMANEIIKIVWATETDDVSTVTLGSFEISLRTPTSGTLIQLRRYAGGYGIEVSFGACGSEARSTAILVAAERNGVKFDAYAGEEKIQHCVQ